MTNAITRTSYLTIVLTLFGCYTALKTSVPMDGSHHDAGGADATPSGLLDTGLVPVTTDTGHDTTGTGGIAVDAPIGGNGVDSGQGGAPVDTATVVTGGASGSGGVVGTGGSGTGGTLGSGGSAVDGPASPGPEVGPDVPLSCAVGYYVCNGSCIPATTPCAGTCPTGKTYCQGSNTCVPASGCCTPADCTVGGPNTVATCSAGLCGIECSSAKLTLCGSACSDLMADPANCRTCGNKCGAATPTCSSGTCVQCVGAGDCTGNRVCSNNQCVCPNTDAACGTTTCTPCASPTPRCQAGACVGCIDVGDCPSGYSCVANQCKAPMACGDTLPAVTFPTVSVVTATPPVPAGGAITEGVYTTTKVTCYSPDYPSVSGDSFELRNGKFHRRHVSYSTSGSALTGYEELGTYAASGAAMALDTLLCGGSLGGQSLWKYTASPTQIDMFTGSASGTCIQTFTLQK